MQKSPFMKKVYTEDTIAIGSVSIKLFLLSAIAHGFFKKNWKITQDICSLPLV